MNLQNFFYIFNLHLNSKNTKFDTNNLEIYRKQNILEIKPCPIRLNFYKNFGLNVYAIDNNIENINKIKNLTDVEIKYCYLNSLPYKNEKKFDIITFFNLISELSYTESKLFLISLTSLLNKNGVIIFSLPEESYYPIWWNKGEKIENGKICLTGDFKSQSFFHYNNNLVNNILFQFIDIEYIEFNEVRLWKAKI